MLAFGESCHRQDLREGGPNQADLGGIVVSPIPEARVHAILQTVEAGVGSLCMQKDNPGRCSGGSGMGI